jgi:sporulation protein YlmC with PRC-barrel domain
MSLARHFRTAAHRLPNGRVRHLKHRRPASVIALVGLIFVTPLAFAQADNRPPAPPPSGGHTSDPARPLRLEDYLWRSVQNKKGESLGSVNDVLVHLPSGRIVFVSVLPNRLFDRPKAVPPTALTVSPGRHGPLVADISIDWWINAPIVDWSEALVLDLTEQGGKVHAYYQQAWLEPPPGFDWSIDRAVSPEQRANLPRFVSLRKLEHERLQTGDAEQVGYVYDFLLDWENRRATHALVSPERAPVEQPRETWFAVPVALIGPAKDYDALPVNREMDAFRIAATPSDNRIPSADAGHIYRYPIGSQPVGQAAE